MRLVAGVDGGGTRTRLALADETGRVLGQGESSRGNWLEVGATGLVEAVRSAWRSATNAAGLEPQAVEQAHIGLAGVATKSERAAVREALRGLGLTTGVDAEVSSDLVTAHIGALGGDCGIVVIAGTGSVALGRDETGREARAGGLGPQFDDLGSAHDLGRRGLAAVARSADGRAAGTTLTATLLDALGVADVGEAARTGLGRRVLAGLAPLVTAAAEAGDTAAERLALDAAADLASCVTAVASRLRFDSPRVSTAGGLLRGCEWYRARVLAEVERSLPTARFTEPELEPLRGALLLALTTLHGGALPAEVGSRLRH